MYVLATYLALVLLATPLHATPAILALYWALAVATAATLGMRAPALPRGHFAPALLMIPAGVFFAMRLLPLLIWGPSALGADIGAYYAAFNACFASLVACAAEPLALAAYPLYALGADTHAILLLMQLVAGAAAGTGAYLIVRDRFGPRAAFWTAMAYALSLPQFLFYWSFFLKMETGIALSLFSLHAYARQRKSAAAYAALAGIVHPLTLVPLAAAIAAAGIADGKKRYAFSVAGAALLITALFRLRELAGYAAYALSYAGDAYAPSQGGLLAGHFVGFSFYHDALMLFYVPFGLLAAAWCARERNMPAVAWYALANLALVSVNAVFHNRFIVMFDLSCIILSGYALAAFSGRLKTAVQKTALVALITVLAGYSLRASARMEPLVNAEEFAEILSLQGKYAGLPVFVNSGTYRQFVAGYSGHPVVVLPFGDEPWKALPTPSLVYNARRSTPVRAEEDPYFTRISERFLKYAPATAE